MKKLFLSFVMLVTLVTFSNIVYSQDKEPDPFIISIVPDSLFAKYDYSQTVFIVVDVSPKIGKDPTEAAIEDLKKKIVATCKLNKFDGFILNQMVFAIYPEVAKLIGYGTLIKKKNKPAK